MSLQNRKWSRKRRKLGSPGLEMAAVLKARKIPRIKHPFQPNELKFKIFCKLEGYLRFHCQLILYYYPWLPKRYLRNSTVIVLYSKKLPSPFIQSKLGLVMRCYSRKMCNTIILIHIFHQAKRQSFLGNLCKISLNHKKS